MAVPFQQYWPEPALSESWQEWAGDMINSLKEQETDLRSTLGVNVFDNDGNVLSNASVINSDVSQSSIIPNSLFTQIRSTSAGVRPAGWYGMVATVLGATLDTLPVRYYDETNPNAGLIWAPRDLLAPSVSVSRAFRINPDTTYEIVVTAVADGAMGGTTDGLTYGIYEYDSELGLGEFAVGIVGGGLLYDAESGIVNNDDVQTLTSNEALTSTPSTFTSTYTPSATAKWASLGIAVTDDGTENPRFLQAVVRDKSTLGATAGTDLKNEAGTVVSDNAVINSRVVYNQAPNTTLDSAFTSPYGSDTSRDSEYSATVDVIAASTESLSAKFGTNVLRIGKSGVPQNVDFLYVDPDYGFPCLVIGEKYTIGFWAYSTDTSTTEVAAHGTADFGSITIGASTGAWVWYTTSATVGAGGLLGDTTLVYKNKRSAAYDGVVLIDGIVVVPGDVELDAGFYAGPDIQQLINTEQNWSDVQDDNGLIPEDLALHGELIHNPGFEDGLEGWTADGGTPTLNTDDPHSGAQCVELGSVSEGVLNDRKIQASQGDSFIINGYYRASAAVTGSDEMYARIKAKAVHTSGSSTISTITVGKIEADFDEWRCFNVYYTVPAVGAEISHLLIGMKGDNLGSNNQPMLYDGIEVQRHLNAVHTTGVPFPNSDLEYANAGWDAAFSEILWGLGVDDNPWGHEHSFYQNISVTSGPTQALTHDHDHPVESGDQFLLVGWAGASGTYQVTAGTPKMIYRIEWLDSAKANLSEDDLSISVTSSAYFRGKTTVTAPASSAFARLHCYYDMTGTTNSGTTQYRWLGVQVIQVA